MSGRPVALLYDRACGICAWITVRVLDLDRGDRLRPVAIQSEEGGRLLESLTRAERLASFHLADADGRVLSGGQAMGALSRCVPLAAPLAAAFDALPGPTDRGYRWVATHRTRLSRLIPAGARARAKARLAADG